MVLGAGASQFARELDFDVLTSREAYPYRAGAALAARPAIHESLEVVLCAWHTRPSSA